VSYLTPALIIMGYVALVLEFGWLGLAVGVVHVALLALAGWRR
jgi:hypothetical protein